MAKPEKEERICAYCENSTESIVPETFLCRVKGVVSARSHCPKFFYDPRKRTVRPRRLPDNSEND